jgi:threonylcarbamoyladenosine tRNA methylthiotransferase MtaB
VTGTRVITLGCRLNAFESEVMRAQAEAAGARNTVIINSCAVTGEAERQARQTIRRARKDSPDARIIVTGCAAQINPEKFAAMAEVDQVLGNTEKLLPEYYRDGAGGGPIKVADIMNETSLPELIVPGFENRSRAFIQIQQGCDHRCTFCIIPFGRGNSRSVPLRRIIEQARRLTEAGYKEAVLTGVDISSYQGENAGGLGALVRQLLAAVPKLARLRLSSLDPAMVDQDLIALAADEPRLMPHFHLSVQAGNDLILKRMKRRHTRSQVIELCGQLRRARADIQFGADLIAGFPTETDTMFADTERLVAEAGLAYLHVFPYSPRPGTPAARMPQTGAAVARARARKLRAAGNRVKAGALAQMIGRRATVLTENDGRGYTEHYAPVKLIGGPRSGPGPGSLLPVQITSVQDLVLTAEPLR